MKQAKWKALIADDEPVARRGVRQLLASFPEFAVAGECRNGAEVLAALNISAPDVIFLDIKLNSDVAVWRGIIDGFQDRLPGGRWIGGVHVGAAGDNGLSDDDLRGAYAAGLRRVTFGLEWRFGVHPRSYWPWNPSRHIW